MSDCQQVKKFVQSGVVNGNSMIWAVENPATAGTVTRVVSPPPLLTPSPVKNVPPAFGTPDLTSVMLAVPSWTKTESQGTTEFGAGLPPLGPSAAAAGLPATRCTERPLPFLQAMDF